MELLILNGVNRLINVYEFSIEKEKIYRQSVVLPRQNFSNDTVEDVKYSSSGSHKKFIWLRFTLPLHCALAMIELVVSQSLRFVSSLAIGLLTLRVTYIRDAFKDLLSIPVQLIALPIITVVGCVNARQGLKTLEAFKKRTGGEIKEFETKGRKFIYYRLITGLARGILGAPAVIVTQTTYLCSLFLIGDLSKTSKKIKKAFKYLISSFILPILGCGSVFSNKTMNYIHKAQQINFSMQEHLA